MSVRLRRWAAGMLLGLARQPARNRQRFDAGESGLRILILHAMNDRELDRFLRLIDWCAERFSFVGPEAADRVAEGVPADGDGADRLLVTVDDGHWEDHRTASWLAERGIRATFFVIPS